MTDKISGTDSQEVAVLRVHSLSPVFALVGAAFLGVVGFHPVLAATHGQGMSMDGRKSGSQPAIDASALGITGAQHITVYVLPGGNGLGLTGPDKAHHDTMVPSSFVLWKGIPVTFTVINFDAMSHSITAPGLGVNIIVKPGVELRNCAVAPSTTTYTFIPANAGEFRWFCVVPCDMPTHWAMSASYDGPGRDGFMAGMIRVL